VNSGGGGPTLGPPIFRSQFSVLFSGQEKAWGFSLTNPKFQLSRALAPALHFPNTTSSTFGSGAYAS